MSFDPQQPYAAAPPAAPPAAQAPAPAPGGSFVLGAPGPSGPSGGGSRRTAALAVAGVVVVVGGVLAAVAFTRAEPAPAKQATPRAAAPAPEQATRDDVGGTLKNLATAQESYFMSHDKYTASLGALAAEGFTPAAGVRPKVLRADRAGYCVSASGAGVVLYYDSAAGTVSRTSCG